MNGFIHSIQSLGTVDGPGVRAVIFSTGCPLRCIYCHNPDTWRLDAGEEWEPDALGAKIYKLYPYIKDGGVTFSGGEPCLQPMFFAQVARYLKRRGLHVALDTSGTVGGSKVAFMLQYVDLVILDVKFADEERYKRYTGGTLSRVIEFLDMLEAMKKDVWIRQVVVPGINDTKEDMEALGRLIKPYTCVKKAELLPFRKLCLEKYEKLGIPFLLKDTPEMSQERITELEAFLKN